MHGRLEQLGVAPIEPRTLVATPDVRTGLLASAAAAPRLAILPSAAAPLLPPGLPLAQVWRGIGNEVVARGYARDDHWWVVWPGVGTFLLDAGSHDVVVEPEPGVHRAALEDAFRRGVTPLALVQREHEVLHASAVRSTPGIVGFCAVSGTGKSTLAAALASEGCEHWSDDFLALHLDATGISCPWFSSAPRLDPAVRTALGSSASAGVFAVQHPPAPLAAVAILVRNDAVPAGVVHAEPMEPGEAFTRLLPHTHETQIGGSARVRRSLERYLDLCARVTIFRLAFRPDLDRLRSLAASVAAWIDSLPVRAY